MTSTCFIFYVITELQTEVPLSTVPHYFFIQLDSTKVFDLTSPSGVKVSLKKIIIHEENQAKHNSYLHYDVALVQLVEEVTVSYVWGLTNIQDGK